MKPTEPVPPGFHTVNPYLIVASAADLLDFVKSVFDAVEVVRLDLPDGGIGHAEVRIGDSTIEMADANEIWPAMPGSLHVYVLDIDAVYARALAAGGISVTEPKDQFYGERSASVRDPVGNLWHIATRTEELSHEEMLRRAAELFGKS